MTSSPVAIVTGANRSLGLQVAKNLFADGFTVVLAVRDRSKGLGVLDEISKAYTGPARGNTLAVIKLDLSDAATIAPAVEEFKKLSGRLDVLVNNAAIYDEKRKESFAVNYFNTVAVTEAFLPLLAAPKPDRKIKSRIVLVSSRLGTLKTGANVQGRALEALREQKDLAKINALARAWEEGDDTVGFGVGVFGTASYNSSKALLSTYGRILAQRLADEKVPVNVYIVCPGYVATDINNHSGVKTVEDGADTLSWVAHDESIENDSGKFFAERVSISFDEFDPAILTKKAEETA